MVAAVKEARLRVVVLSDPHYAGPQEQQRSGHESRAVANPVLRRALAAYRRFIWLHRPFEHNHMLERFLDAAPAADLVVGNGDYSCDTAFVGLMDPAAFESARECINQLRSRFDTRLELTYGDHEVGKFSMFGGRGGLRLESWHRASTELNMPPFWRRDLGRYVLLGVVSSLVALPVYTPETLPEERPRWQALRQQHLEAIDQAFDVLEPDQRVILFCHDPTALPFLSTRSAIQKRLGQIELTVIGHLHTPLVLWPARLLAGMPTIRFLGNTARRLSEALNRARHWRPFKVRLCPSLTGCQLLKDGGFLSLELDPAAADPAAVRFHPLDWT